MSEHLDTSTHYLFARRILRAFWQQKEKNYVNDVPDSHLKQTFVLHTMSPRTCCGRFSFQLARYTAPYWFVEGASKMHPEDRLSSKFACPRQSLEFTEFTSHSLVRRACTFITMLTYLIKLFWGELQSTEPVLQDHTKLNIRPLRFRRISSLT